MLNTTNFRESRLNTEHSQKPMFLGKTIKKGRFTIEDYSDCYVSEYDSFIHQLQNCDDNKNQVKNEEIMTLIKIVELQNQQIKLLKSLIPSDIFTDETFDKSVKNVDILLANVKKKMEGEYHN